MKVIEIKRCVICKGKLDKLRKPDGTVYWDEGHNPYPIKEKGRCCIKCNNDKVIPARFGFF